MKKLQAVIIGIFMMTMAVMLGSVSTKAATVVNFPTINNTAELDSVSGFYNKAVSIEKNEKNEDILSFTLAEDSWVCLKGVFAKEGGTGHGVTTATVFSDAAMTNKAAMISWGYFSYDPNYSGFLKQGTYYINITTEASEFGSGTIEDTVVILGAALPVSKILTPTITVAKNKSYAMVTLPTALGTYTKGIQYQPGNIDVSNISNSTFWKWKISDFWTGGDNATLLEAVNGTCSFKATQKTYTIMIEDTNGGRYSQVIHIGLDKSKPKVTGVKNNKTYKKKVKIKYSDKDSGIKFAKLNGKKFKSGKKVTKKGNYKLIVIDKAGNKTTIKFKIK